MQFPGQAERQRQATRACGSFFAAVRRLPVVVAKPLHLLIAECRPRNQTCGSEYIDRRLRGASSAAELKVALTKPDQPIRRHIQPDDVKHWSKHWKVTAEQIRTVIEKVGNSVAAVEKELTLQGLIDA